MVAEDESDDEEDVKEFLPPTINYSPDAQDKIFNNCHGKHVGHWGADKTWMKMNRLYPGHNISFAALGVFILWVGWYGFNPGSQLTYAGAANANATTYIALTTTLAAAAGAVAALITAWGLFGKPDVMSDTMKPK